MGAMPTTSTIAGMVNGSRQMNSTSRRTRGTRRCTHVIVGTSSTSMPTTVSRASSTEVRIAETRSSSVPMARHASRERVSPAPRVENSTIATSGSTR